VKVRLKNPSIAVAVDSLGYEQRHPDLHGVTASGEQRSAGVSVVLGLPPSAALVVDAEQSEVRREWSVGGEMVVAEPLDWIVTGAHGAPLPCKPDRFAELFEFVAE
jgi:hypothetical protein